MSKVQTAKPALKSALKPGKQIHILSDDEEEYEDEVVVVSKIQNSKRDSLRKTTPIDYNDIDNTLKNMIQPMEAFAKLVEEVKELTQGTLNDTITLANKTEKEYIEKGVQLKKEYDNKTEQLDKEYVNKTEQTEKEYVNKTEQLDKEFKTLNDELTETFKNKNTELLQQFKHNKKDLEQQFKNEKIDTEQQLRQYKLEACEKIATENDYKLIPLKEYEKNQSELDELKETHAELQSNTEDKIKEKIEIERQSLQEKLAHHNTTIELNHKAEIAELTAQNRQQIKEIEMLNKLIINLTNEVSEQRLLTKEIAIASSKPQINQSLTKSKD
jgi:hypothetical protein